MCCPGGDHQGDQKSHAFEFKYSYFARKDIFPGFSLSPEVTALNLKIKKDSLTSLSRWDVKPDSSIVAVMFLNEWPGIATCLESGRSGRLLACDLWLLNRNLKASSVCPMY